MVPSIAYVFSKLDRHTKPPPIFELLELAGESTTQEIIAGIGKVAVLLIGRLRFWVTYNLLQLRTVAVCPHLT